MLVHRRVTPSIKFAGTHLYTWVERERERLKYFAQERNTTSPLPSGSKSGDERITIVGLRKNLKNENTVFSEALGLSLRKLFQSECILAEFFSHRE